MVEPGVAGRSGESIPQNLICAIITPIEPQEVGEVDRRWGELWAKPQRGSEFSFGLADLATPSIKASQRRTAFRAIGVLLLRRYEFTGSRIKEAPFIRRLLRRGNRRQQLGGANPDALHRIPEQW